MGHDPEPSQVVELGDVLNSIVGGGTPSRNEPTYWGGDIPWASVKDMKRRNLERTQESITRAGLEHSSARLIPTGTVIVCTRMNVGAVTIAATPIAINQDLKALFPKKGLLPQYLYYLLEHHGTTLARRSTGSTVQGLRLEQLQKLEFLLPAPSVQECAAKVLGAVDDAIDAGEAVVGRLDHVRYGLTEDLLRRGLPARHGRFVETSLGLLPADWAVVPLSEIAEVERGKFTHRPRGDPRLYGGEYPFIQTGDVTACGGRITSFSQTLNESGLAVSRLFRAGTVVVTIAANIGETGVAEFDVAFPDSLVGIQCGPRVHNRYLELALRARKRELSDSAPQSAQKNINLETLRPLLIPLPPLDEQEAIAGAIASVSDRIEKERAALAERRRLKAALADALLTGKIRVPVNDVAW